MMQADEMKKREIHLLAGFFKAIEEDACIGSTHISLYIALYYFYCLNLFSNPIFIRRADVMKSSKISGIATYHKCMRDLITGGYIEYKPSFHPAVASEVIINEFTL